MPQPIDFQNTKIAFGHKSKQQLRKAYCLFRLVASPVLVKFGKVATKLALKLRLPIKGLVKKTIFAQFVGGETAEEADNNTDVLSDYGIGTILDYSVEGKHSPEGFEETTNEILKTVHISAGVESVPFCVFKLSGIGRFSLLKKKSAGQPFSADEEEEWAVFEERAERICRTAFEAGTPVMIDAEESWIQVAADDLVERLMKTYNSERAIVYHTLQMYRHDRLAYLIKLKAQSKMEGWHLGVKIVRGAYMEKERERAQEKGYPDPIQATREAKSGRCRIQCRQVRALWPGQRSLALPHPSGRGEYKCSWTDWKGARAYS